ncbi:MAG: hypothetical protein JWM87_2434 [Candidatus Eremiobacteraeota bacterium]|nr:hypothetical protein [Candidatus Eremiobacteraeota bacterium]
MEVPPNDNPPVRRGRVNYPARLPVRCRMKNVVPLKQPESFKRFGIDWTRAAASESERQLREAFLTYECSCGPNGLVSVLLLAAVSRRQGIVADDLQSAADHAEVLLGVKLRKHQDDALHSMHAYVREGGIVWS